VADDLALKRDVIVEYAQLYAGGGMLVRYQDPEIERIYPLATWIEYQTRFGGRVYRRRIIVVKDWTRVRPRRRSGPVGHAD